MKIKFNGLNIHFEFKFTFLNVKIDFITIVYLYREGLFFIPPVESYLFSMIERQKPFSGK